MRREGSNPLPFFMDRWTEYDPRTGIVETNEFDELTGRWTINKSADVEPVVEAAKAIANSRATDIGIKKGLWSYCVVPQAVEYELLWKHGININNRGHWPRMFDLINRDYPYLKTTHKHHAMRGGGQIFASGSSGPTN